MAMYVIKLIDGRGAAYPSGPNDNEAQSRGWFADTRLAGRFVRAELWQGRVDDAAGWVDDELIASKP